MVIDMNGASHGENDGKFQSKVYSHGDLVFPEREDDYEVAESLARVALWAGVGNDDEPLDNGFDISDIDEDSLQVEVNKAQKFWREATDLHLTGWCSKDEFVHDFWLDRNGHGTGFWNKCPNEEMGRKLSSMAKEYGSCDLLEDDNGTLSFYPG